MRWWVISFLVLVDQASKKLVEAGGGSVVNQRGLGGVGPTFLWLDGVAILVALWMTYKGRSWGWWLLLGGGISNVFDRLVKGGVVDIFSVFGWWFNVADAAITLGVLWLLLVQLHHGESSATKGHLRGHGIGRCQ